MSFTQYPTTTDTNLWAVDGIDEAERDVDGEYLLEHLVQLRVRDQAVAVAVGTHGDLNRRARVEDVP
eukprot:scaffold941_cov81-Phaeocystis_antarctica.AAC.9